MAFVKKQVINVRLLLLDVAFYGQNLALVPTAILVKKTKLQRHWKLNKLYKNKIYLNISSVILHSIVCAISGALGWIIQLIIVQISTFGIVVYSYTKLNKGSNFSFFLPLLFYSFYIPVSVSIKSYQTYPIWISGIVLIVLLRFLLISETSKKILFFYLSLAQFC